MRFSESWGDELSNGASIVSSLAPVRAALLQLQKKLGSQPSIVMDGRDIGTVIIPDAELKIYVDAEIEVRAQRRFKQYRKNGKVCTFAEVLADLRLRDHRDKSREHAPLLQADDAFCLDTTHQSIDESIAQMMGWVEALQTQAVYQSNQK